MKRRRYIGAVLTVLFVLSGAAGLHAAEALVDDTLHSGTGDINPGPSTVFVSDQVGYSFFMDTAKDDPHYAKTTDGGATWGGEVSLSGVDLNWVSISVWYDRWTAGDTTGTVIHVVASEALTDETWYIRIDSTTDTVRPGGWVQVNQTDCTAHDAATDGPPSITRGADSNLYVYVSGTFGGSPSAIVARSIDNGENWTEIASVADGLNDDNDIGQLLPLPDGDILLIHQDITLNTAQSKVWDGAAWSGSWTTIDTWVEEASSGDSAWGACHSLASGDIYLAAPDIPGQNGSAALKAYRFDEGTRTWSTVTDIMTNWKKDLFHAGMMIDQNNDDLYAVYMRGYWAEGAQVFFRKSSDGGMSWSTEYGPLGTADDVRIFRHSLTGDERLYATWLDTDDMDTYGNTVADLNAGGAPAAPTAITTLGAIEITDTFAVMRGEVTGPAPDAVIKIFWGTSDGGTDPSAWVNTNVLSAVDTFESYVSGLSADTLYFYRCYASNALGQVWATDTDSFTTRGPDALITTTLYSANNEASASPSVVFISDQVGYAFYVEATVDAVTYNKTYDGGQTWTNETTIATDQDWLTVGVWYEQWTPGNTNGTLIHIAGSDVLNDELWYINLDTTDDSLKAGGWVQINTTDGSSTAANAADATPSITLATDGTLYACGGGTFGGVQQVLVASSIDGGDNWVEMGGSGDGFDDDVDFTQLLPLSGGDILAIRENLAAGDSIDSKVWNGAAWDGSWMPIGGLIESASEDAPWGATLYKPTGDIYLAAPDATLVSGTLKSYKYDEGLRTWSTLSDITTYPMHDLGDSKMLVDQNNGNLYAIFTKGPLTYSVSQYYSLSTDEGATWSDPVRLNTTLPDDVRSMRGNFASADRLYAVWYNADLNDLFGTTVADLFTPGFSIDDVATTEGDVGTKDMIFTITALNMTVVSDITVEFATSNGTAEAGTDYIATNGTVTISAGQTSTQIVVTVLNDVEYEGADEDFYIHLSNPAGAAITKSPGIGAIAENDVWSGVVYVNVNATGGDTGNTWEHAYTDLNSAMNNNIADSQIWVAEGTYYPTNGTDRTAAFVIPDGVVMYGGFTNGMLSFSERDIAAYPAILSGDIDTDSSLDPDNSHSVLDGSSADGFIIDGFTITMGYSEDSVSVPAGAGAGVNFGVDTVTTGVFANCSFVDNAGYRYGGAIYLDYFTVGSEGLTITNCLFARNMLRYDNTSTSGGSIYAFNDRPITILDSRFMDHGTVAGDETYNGGAIYVSRSALVIRRTVFGRNKAQGAAGAIYVLPPSGIGINPMILDDCDFFENSNGVGDGGAIWLSRSYTPGDMISNCQFYINSAARSGGALDTYSLSGDIVDCVFAGNSVVTEGGAIHSDRFRGAIKSCVVAGNTSDNGGGLFFTAIHTDGRIENTLVAGNKAIGIGGGISTYSGTNVFANCTIADNLQSDTVAAGDGGGALRMYLGSNSLQNCIIYGNDADADGPQIMMRDARGMLSIESTDLEGGLAGIHDYAGGATINDDGGNITDNPAFIISVTGAWTAEAVYTNGTGRTVLRDLSASWANGSLVGRLIDPDTSSGNHLYYITSNSANTMVVLGDASVGNFGDSYEIKNYLISAASPCMDTGTANSLVEDLVGESRPIGPGVDMGAYENPSSGDATPPLLVTGLSAVGGQATIQLDWTNPADADFRGVLILRRAGLAPTGIPVDTNSYSSGDTVGDGTVAYVGSGSDATPGNAATWTDIGLDDEITYYYEVFAYDWTPNYAASVGANAATELDITAPGEIVTPVADPNDGEVIFSWFNPTDADFASVMVVRRIGLAPTGTPTDTNTYTAGQMLGDGTIMYIGPGSLGIPGAASGWVDPGLDNGTNYFYRIFTLDEVPNYSVGTPLSAIPSIENVVFVNHSSSGANDGTSWADAYTNLSEAIVAAQTGSNIWVAEGTYYPGSSRGDSFHMPQGIGLYGGFKNGAITIYHRDPDTYETILSGDIDRDGILDEDNVYHVVSNAWDGGYIDGFTITMGHASSGLHTDEANGGGGLKFVGNMSMTIANCRFENNYAYRWGGAIHAKHVNIGFGGGLFVTNCVFESNSTYYSTEGGGAIFVYRGSITIEDSVFCDNIGGSPAATGSHGGALYAINCDPIIRRCTFYGNMARHSGGAIYSTYGYKPLVIVDSDFYENWAYSDGSAILLARTWGGDEVIRNCRFFGNDSEVRSGAVDIYRYNGVLEDCIFSGNQMRYIGTAEGATLFISESDVTVTNCVFAGNRNGTETAGEGGAIGISACDLENPTIVNTLLVGNVARRGGGIWATASHALIANNTIAGNASLHNAADYGGGGVMQYQGTVDIVNNILFDNVSYIAGRESVHLRQASGVAVQNFENNLLPAGSHYVQDGTYNDIGGNINSDPMFKGGTNGTWTASRSYDSSDGMAVLTDSSANYVPMSLVGGFVNPNTGIGYRQYYIASNSATKITILGRAEEATFGAAYQLYDYHPRNGGAGIDAATNSFVVSDDLDGVSRPQASASDIGAYEYEQDGAPPNDVIDLAVSTLYRQVTLTWTNPADSDFEGVIILRKVDSEPTGAPVDETDYSIGAALGDGTIAYIGPGSTATAGEKSTWIDTGLSTGIDYHYKVISRDEKPNYSPGVTANAVTPSDAASPATVSGLTVQGGDGQITLSWVNPSDSDFQAVLITRKAGSSAPSGTPADGSPYGVGWSVGDGEVVYNGTGTSGTPDASSGWTDTGIPNDAELSYAVYAYDLVPNYSVAATGTATTDTDVTAPSPVGNLAAAAADGQIALSWMNPTDSDFGGVLVVRREGGAPSGTVINGTTYSVGNAIGDGTVAYVGSALNASPGMLSGLTDTGLQNGSDFYYKVYAYDEELLYSTDSSVNATPAVTGVIYVDVDASGADDGSTWANAFTNLQDALAAAVSGQSIWAAKGIYYPIQGAGLTRTFQMAAGVGVYGGFTNGMGSMLNRDWDLYKTILSGDLDMDGILDAENAYHVIIGAHEAAIDGLTVTMGYAGDLTDPNRKGGGLQITGVDDFMQINNCTFATNSALQRGGAIELYYLKRGVEASVISNCTFVGNTTTGTGGGGAIAAWQRELRIYDSHFEANVSGQHGGAIQMDDGAVIIKRTQFINNLADNQGGAIQTFGLRNAEGIFHDIDECTFGGNSARYGGALNVTASLETGDLIRNSTFSGNKATASGGAVILSSYDSTIDNCIFSGNEGTQGGGLRLSTSDCIIRNTIFCGNAATNAGGGVYDNGESRPLFENCAVIGNRSGTDGGGIALNDVADLNPEISQFINCTIMYNQVNSANPAYGGGGLHLRSAGGDSEEVHIRNCIIAENETLADSGNQIFLEMTGTGLDIQLANNNLEDGLGGILNPNGVTVTDEGGNFSSDSGFFGGFIGGWSHIATYDGTNGVTVLRDNTRAWEQDDLVGQFVNPDTSGANLRCFYIIGNTMTTITVLGDATMATASDPYRVRNFHLDEGSPCIDAGSNNGPTTDIEGSTRPQGTALDVGAYEGATFQAPPKGAIIKIWGVPRPQ